MTSFCFGATVAGFCVVAVDGWVAAIVLWLGCAVESGTRGLRQGADVDVAGPVSGVEAFFAESRACDWDLKDSEEKRGGGGA